MRPVAEPSARREAAALLEAFLARAITSDDLEGRWPRSCDPALEEIRLAVWLTYDDFEPVPGPSCGHELVQRCVDFLHSSEAYGWHVPHRWQRVLGTCVGLLSLGFLKPRFSAPTLDAPWPFSAPPAAGTPGPRR